MQWRRWLHYYHIPIGHDAADPRTDHNLMDSKSSRNRTSFYHRLLQWQGIGSVGQSSRKCYYLPLKKPLAKLLSVAFYFTVLHYLHHHCSKL